MLDTIREYAWQQLDESEERHEVHRRHAEHFLGTAASTNLTSQKMIEGEPQHELALLEQDNFRAALAWAIDAREFALGLALATELEQFWVQNDPAEGARWFRALLDDPDAASVDPHLRAHALRSRGSSTFIAGDPADAERAWEQSLELFDQLGDEHGRAVLLHRLGISAMVRGDLDQARERLEASHSIHLRNPDPTARSWGLAQTTGTLGGVARDAGDDARAAELFRESVELAEDAGGPWWKGGMLAELAALALRNGRTDDASAFAVESLMLADQLRDRPGRVFGVGLLAIVAAERGELERAGRLWGAIEDERAFAPVGGWQRHRDACEARIRQSANAEFDRGLAAGRELELDEAVEEALARA
jgi:tetratricopeptide (TPR) repeat protein